MAASRIVRDSRREHAEPNTARYTWNYREIVVEPVAPETRRIALSAFARYGKGRHPAQLNFGDCFAYACARHLGQPLMFKGGEFPQTDIEAA